MIDSSIEGKYVAFDLSSGHQVAGKVSQVDMQRKEITVEDGIAVYMGELDSIVKEYISMYGNKQGKTGAEYTDRVLYRYSLPINSVSNIYKFGDKDLPQLKIE